MRPRPLKMLAMWAAITVFPSPVAQTMSTACLVSKAWRVLSTAAAGSRVGSSLWPHFSGYAAGFRLTQESSALAAVAILGMIAPQ